MIIIKSIPNRRCNITDKAIAEAIGVGQVTFSRWKQTRPELYKRIKKSYECEELLNKMDLTIDELKEAIKAYKSKEGDSNEAKK